VNAALVLFMFAVGAALVGFWTVARFPSVGPQTFLSALVVVVAAFVLQSPLLTLVGPVIRSLGVAAALLFVVLPSLTLLFWTLGCLVRSLVALIAPYRP
jgi:hypothetical protein